MSKKIGSPFMRFSTSTSWAQRNGWDLSISRSIMQNFTSRNANPLRKEELKFPPHNKDGSDTIPGAAPIANQPFYTGCSPTGGRAYEAAVNNRVQGVGYPKADVLQILPQWPFEQARCICYLIPSNSRCWPLIAVNGDGVLDLFVVTSCGVTLSLEPSAVETVEAGDGGA